MTPGRPLISVLIVDDDEATLNLLATFLRRHGYRVLTAANPVRGIELLKSDDIKLVITDWMMPHVDGIAFTQQIHELEKYREVPVILMTAYGNDQVYETGMRRGVALTLSKPLELNKLLDLVGFATATPGGTFDGT